MARGLADRLSVQFIELFLQLVDLPVEIINFGYQLLARFGCAGFGMRSGSVSVAGVDRGFEESILKSTF